MVKNKKVTYKKFNNIEEILNYIDTIPQEDQRVIFIDYTIYEQFMGGIGIDFTNPLIDTKYFCTGKFMQFTPEDTTKTAHNDWLDIEEEGKGIYFFKVLWESGEENFYIPNTLGYVINIEDNLNNTIYNCCDNPVVISIDDSIMECQKCLSVFSNEYELPSETTKSSKKLEDNHNNIFIEIKE
jgi:hypothetical protein